MFAATVLNPMHRGYYVRASKYAARAVFTAKVHDKSLDGIA